MNKEVKASHLRWKFAGIICNFAGSGAYARIWTEARKAGQFAGVKIEFH